MSTKAELRMLEKIYSAEIDAALSDQPLRSLFQTRSKLIYTLRDQGLVVERQVKLGGRFPVTVKGWELTLLGNFTYCMTCGSEE